MPPSRILSPLYILNAALLITHEIDSAYWEEWDLFGIPGGIQVFLVLNFLLVLVLLIGQTKVTSGQPAGRIYALISAAGGVFAFTIHTYFLTTGRPEFNLPVSIGLLVVTLFVSLALGWVVVGKKGD